MRRQWWVLSAVLCLVAVAAPVHARREASRAGRAERGREGGRRRLHERHDLAREPDPGGLPRGRGPPGAGGSAASTPSPFRFEPRIQGTAVWAAPDRIEFRPAERLPDGQTYAASLDLAALFPAGKAPLARFDFVFSTMRQSFDVAVEGLQSADATDVKRQALTGRLVTADVEDAPGVEKVLRASHDGRDLPVSWAHETNRRVHAFTVAGIERAEQATALRLAWDGRPDRGRPQGGARDRRARPRHLHRGPGARGRGPGAARRAALHRPAEGRART